MRSYDKKRQHTEPKITLKIVCGEIDFLMLYIMEVEDIGDEAKTGSES